MYMQCIFIQEYNVPVAFLKNLKTLGKTHIKKSVFFSGRTTKVLPSHRSMPHFSLKMV